MTLLRTGHGIGVPDVPPGSRYYLERYDDLRALVATLSAEQGLGDRVAWEASFSPEDSWNHDERILRDVVARRRKRKKARA